jgi:hypothetical protein
MIKKYLNLLTQAINSFKHLGRGNSWIDYFHTVGFEFLLLLITVISIAGIFIILFGPYKGTIKIKRYFMGKLNLPCEHLKKYSQYIQSAYEKLGSIYYTINSPLYDKIFEKDNDAKNYFQKIDFNSTIEEIRDLLNNAALLKMPAPSSDIINLDQFNVILEKINNISSISDAKNARIIVNNFKTALKKYGVEYNETLSFKNAYYGYNEFIESKYLTKGFVNYMKEKCNINIDPVDLIKKRKKANIKMGITLTVFYTIYILIVAPLVMMLF